jgi:6-pyruvoyltetrahydropterin/6-carboxytetrahydropterin synthase
MKFQITREIGIDAGHRVTYHGSKCRNVHGHRYTVQATCEGPLYREGEQQGMVLDFGFLKEEMMSEIDEPCDHGMILWDQDPLVPLFLPQSFTVTGSVNHGPMGKVYIVPFVPTAENLARHWFERLAPRVTARTKDQAWLKSITVWETPNCMAKYEP